MSNGTNTNTKEKNEDKGFFGNIWEDVKEGAEDIIEGTQDIIEDYTGPLTDNQEEEEEAQAGRDIKEITDEEGNPSEEAEDYLTSLSNKDQVYQFEEEEGIQLFEGEEETVVPALRDKFSNLLSGPNKKGFQFEESGIFDNVTITAPNGEKLQLSLDNLRRSSNLEGVQKLNAFMLKHSKDFSKEDLATTHDPDDDVQRIVDIQNGSDITDEQKRKHEEDAMADMEGGWKQMVGDFLSKTGESLVEWENKLLEENPNAKYEAGSGMATSLGNMLSGMGNWETFNPMQKSFEKANSYFNDPVSEGGLGGKIPETDENGEVIYDEDGNPVTRDVTDQDLRDFALQDRIDHYKEQDIKEQVNSFLNIYDEEEGGEAKDYLEAQSARILKENQSVVNKIGVLQESFTNDYNNYYNEAEKVKEKLAKGETLTPAEVKAFNNLQSGVFKKIELMKELKDPYQKALEQSRTYDKAEDVLDNIADPTLSTVYNGLTTIEGLVGQGAWLAGNVLEFAQDKAFGAMDEKLGFRPGSVGMIATGGFNPIMGLISADGMKELGRTLMDDADERKTHLRDLPKGYHNLGNFVEKAINGTVENLPQLGLAYATGGGSIGANMAVFGVSGAASKHFEMTKENEEWHAEHGENMYNTNQMIMAPILYGGAESVTMVPEVLMMRGAFKGGGKSPFSKSLAGKVFNTTFGYAKAAGTELPQEIGTQIGQNAIDKYLLEKDDVELSDGIDDDFLIKVVGSAGVFQTYGNVAQGAGKMINGVTSKMYALDMTKNMQPMNVTNEIAQGSKDIQATQMEIAKLKTQKENGGGDVDVIDSQIRNLETKRDRQVKDQQKRVNGALDYSKVGTKGVNKLRGFARQQNQIQKQVAAIKNNPKLKPIEKAEQIETLRKEFDNLESKKAQIFNNENKYQLESQEQVNQLENQARDNLMEKNNGRIPNKQDIAKEAERIYDEQNYVTEKNANEAKVIMENQVAKLESKALTDKINQIDPTKPINTLEATSLPEIKQKVIADMESKGYPKDSEQTQQALQEIQENWDNSAATILQPEVLQDGQKVLNTESHLFDKHQTVIVNKKKADTDANFAARGHELFHGMLWKAFKSSGKGFQNISEGLVTHINNKDKAGAEWLNDELTQLSPDDINYHEEVIAKIADGMRNKQIKITPDISKRIGGLLRQAGQELGVDTKLMIKDPADMFELIDSYNKNLKSDGRLSGALKSALEQGVVVDPKLQPKRQLQPDQRLTKQYKDEKAFESKIQKLWEDGKIDQILESYKPRVKRILESEWKNYLEANNITPGTQRYNDVVDAVLNEKRGVLDMIMEYDIKKGVPLSGYIGSTMQKRGISEQVFFAVPDTQGQYKQEIDAQTRKIADEVIEEIVEAKKDLLKETINLDPSILNEVVNAVTKTFGVDLGDITSPKFKQKLQDNFKLQLQKTIKNMLGTRADYQNYLENNWENIWKSIPQSIVNKSFPELNDKVLTKEGKQAREKTKAGKPLFKKKKLTQKEFMDYFNPPSVNPQTGKRSGLAGTRKDGLANAIAQTLALDEVMDVLSIPEVATKFEDINTLLNRKLPKNWKAYVQKAIDIIDASIAEINDPGTVMAGPPKQIITGFLQSLKRLIKSGANILDAIGSAFDANIAPWLRSQKTAVKDVADIKADLLYKLRNLDQASDNFKDQVKEIVTELENISPQEKQENRDFIKQLKKLDDPKINKILEDTRNYNNTYQEKGTKYPNTNVNNKLAKQSVKALAQLPTEIHNILRSMYGESGMYAMFGQKRGVLDSSKKNQGKTDNYYNDFHGDNAPFKNAKDIDAAVKRGDISPELGKMFKDIDFTKVQIQNVNKLKKGDILSKVLDIVKSDMKAADKKAAIAKIYDGSVGTNNIKFAKAMAQFFKEQHAKGNIDTQYVVSMLAAQTSIVESFRSLTDIGGFYLEDGPQDISNWKGEHVKPNAWSMSQLVKYIVNKDSNITDLDGIFDNHSQTFGPKDILNDMDSDLTRTSPLGYRRFFTMPQNQRAKFHIPGTDMNINEKLILDKLIEKDTKSAEKSNKAYLPKNMSVETARLWDKAVSLFKKGNQPQKGITIVDFDQTLANTKEKVIVNMPDGTSKEIGAQEFANEAGNLAEAGATFDFSQFEKVKGAKPGPILPKVKDLAGKYGTDQIHILTARPQAAAAAIQAFMKANGLDIKIENITGLEDGTAQAKRDFIIKKLAEGYNDFFFSDDAIENVKEVKDILDQVDVKSKVYQAEQNFKKDLETEFNTILEENTGLPKEAQINKAKAKAAGARKGSWFKNFWIPYSAEDFSGLLYALIGKGKKGESQWKFLKKALIDPFAKGIRDLNAFKQTLANELGNLKKQYPDVTKVLRKKSGISAYNNAHAIRVYNWSKAGYTAADLDISQTDFNNLIKHVEGNPDMKAFSDKVRQITKIPEGYPKPKENGDWVSGNIDTDIMDIGFIKRAEYLQEWKDNRDKIFSPEMMRKLEYQYGSKYVEAMNDILYRMENGINRPQGGNRLVNAWQNWVNNSVGAIMFFNIRSAVLQTLSATNFINWSDNNPIMAAKAFANQKQFWKDFSFIFNHPTLKQRRAGMDIDVNAQEIARRVVGSKNPVSAALNYLLQLGFTPTRLADSFAIAIGGSSMYRNRVDTYLKKGFTKAEAESKAFLDFQEISEATQQSARPDMISQQQASALGRLVLAFQVTPMQYARLMKKAMQDLVNRRGDDKSNISKIIYYGAVQNFIFNAMQKALFAMLYAQDEEDEEEKLTDDEKKKLANTLNGMSDSVLRGLGVQGAVVSTVKNMIIKFLEQEKRGYRADHAYTLVEGLNISPPIGSKARKVYSGLQTHKFNRDVIKEMGLDIDNPALDAVSNIVSGTTNVPLDRALQNINNVRNALDKRNEAWQRIAILMGWPSWQVEVPRREVEEAKKEVKRKKAEEKKRKKEKK